MLSFYHPTNSRHFSLLSALRQILPTYRQRGRHLVAAENAEETLFLLWGLGTGPGATAHAWVRSHFANCQLSALAAPGPFRVLAMIDILDS